MLEPLELKGKAARVPAWEAVGLIAEHAVGRLAPARESPLVGRSEELAALETLYGRVVQESTPHLVTLVGEAGVGKTRLLREFEGRLAEHPSAPTFRTGRCLPYGSGIVFWALAEVLRAECGIVDPTRPTRPGASSPSTSASWRARKERPPETARPR